jgi:Na+/proline symporter
MFIMAWVFLALQKVIAAITDLPTTPLLIGGTLLAFIYTVASGIYGVILTDLFQYGFAALGALLISYYSVAHVGGLESLWTQLDQVAPAGMTHLTAWSDEATMLPSSVFLTYIMVKWWAHKWADGGGKHIQRMLSARDERHAMWATLFFALNATLVVWPWIMTALSSYVSFGVIEGDPEMAYPKMMTLALPHGALGLSVACLAGAFMSTIDTHLNLGASYVVNDLYRRFWRREADEQHYVLSARVTMGLMLALSVVVSMNMGSVASAWKFLITFASGAGVTWILRWFWWRINAWTELSAMLASGVIATYLKLAHPHLLLSTKLLTCVGGAALVWIPVTLLTAPAPEERLRAFVRRVRPGAFGWRRVYEAEGLEHEPYLGGALLRWALAVVLLFGLNALIGLSLLGGLS